MSGNEDKAIREFALGLIGRYPKNIDLYHEAFAHRSFSEKSNERLECLGDAVLGMIACEYLYKLYPGINEGVISRLRTKLVNGMSLAIYSNSIELHTMIKISTSLQPGRSAKIFQDAFEALIGCLYLDMGYDVCYDLCKMLFNEHFPEKRLWHDSNYKDILNKLQKRLHANVAYNTISQSGPPHGLIYLVKVTLCNKYAHGEGKTIKQAQQDASFKLLRSMGWTNSRTGDNCQFENILHKFMECQNDQNVSLKLVK